MILSPLSAAVLLLAGSGAAGQSPDDLEVRGACPPGNAYRFVWTVTNHQAAPVVKVVVPQYGVQDAFAPEGWKLVELVGSVRQGAPKPGHIEWAAESRATAVRPGQSLEFEVDLPRGGNYQALQTITLGLADGTELRIPMVMCPAHEPFLRRNYPAVGLGVIFALILVVRTIRGRRSARQGTGPPPS